MTKSEYYVTLSPEALAILSDYRINHLIDDDGVLTCKSFTQEGAYVHVEALYPRSKVFAPETLPEGFLETTSVELMLPIHFVLYISSWSEEKSIGFSGKRPGVDKEEDAAH